MIEVTVYFWAGSTNQRILVTDMPDNSTILDLKNLLINPTINTPFSQRDVTMFELADHPAGNPPLGLADDQALVDNQGYDARME